MARPSSFSIELAEAICSAVATSPYGLAKICGEHPEFPVKQTINEWRLHRPEFSAQYARAKLLQADLLAEEALEIADDANGDIIIDPETGQQRCDHEFVHRSRLRIDTRKWLASKLLPKAYGDKQQIDSTITVQHEDTLKDLA